MARMYSRARGKAGSKKPSKSSLSWIRYKPKEIELLVVKLAKQGESCAKIGLILRDTYGIPSTKVVCGKSILQILKEKNIAPEIPEDLVALMRKYLQVKKHLENNKHDYTAKRGLQITESKIFKLIRYYKSVGKLPANWNFDVNKIKVYTQ
ncbi:MAG: 30S ribosomal protein S15 [Candidatus Woesearchaeota archaeon]